MRRVSLSILSVLLLVFSYPPFNIGIFAWFSFLPFFLALQECSLKKAFGLAILTGTLFFLGTLQWIHHVTWPGTLVLVGYLSLYFGLFGIAARYCPSQWLPLFLPPGWVVLEWLRSSLFTGFGWPILGYSQWRFLPLIQVADLTGAYGVSFLVMGGNALLYQWVRRRGERKVLVSSILFVCLFLGVWVYGFFRLNEFSKPSKTLRASVIQGNIPQHLKWDPLLQDGIMEKYEQLTLTASAQNPDLVVWPETAVPGFLPEEKELLLRLERLNKKTGGFLLVGAPWTAGRLSYNSAVFFHKGEILKRYDKLHLVPFGEFIPFEDLFPFLREWIVTGDFDPGSEATIFQHPKGNFSVLICFEDIFPDLVRRFAKESDFLVNITNDAWFGKSGAPFQHAQASAFRAIENRRSVLRAANTGYSCLIDPTGRIVRDLRLGGEALFITGQRTWEVPLFRKETFYTRHSGLFLGLCLLLSAAGIFTSSFSFRK